MGILKLKMGVDQPTPTPEEERRRAAELVASVVHYMPEFAKGIGEISIKHKADDTATMVIHQDAFAAGYDLDEYTMLGMAVKYAGLFGVTITIHGKNHETF